MNVIYRIKNAIFLITQIVFSLLLIFRITAICIFLSFYNVNILKIIVITAIIDLFINNSVGTINNILNIKKYTSELTKSKYTVMEDNDFILYLKLEISKYQQYKIENMSKSKDIVFLQSMNSGTSCYITFPVFNWISYIVIPQNTDISSITQKVLLAHELAHCMGNDVLQSIIANIRIICVIMPLISLFTTGVCVKTIIVSLLSIILFASQIWCKMYAEIIANNLAMEILESIKTPVDKQIAAKILLFPLQLQSDKMKNMTRVKDHFSKIILNIQIDFLNKVVQNNTLIDKISPINIYIMTISILIIFLPVINISNTYLAEFNIKLTTVFISTIITIIILGIALFLFHIFEGVAKWKMKGIIGI